MKDTDKISMDGREIQRQKMLEEDEKVKYYMRYFLRFFFAVIALYGFLNPRIFIGSDFSSDGLIIAKCMCLLFSFWMMSKLLDHFDDLNRK